MLVDLEATYRFNDMFRVTVGAENVFDVELDLEGDGTLAFLGARTAITSPFGNNGGFMYIRLAADF
ncbi:MAG: TonB-dependent receptor [Proteobacteria bacterium]|nr:TonB-dependent receptor [Pseudomonadota bacterium]MDA1062735.1 TonB-dependent receptor [Pseudomonadota bacterium]